MKIAGLVSQNEDLQRQKKEMQGVIDSLKVDNAKLNTYLSALLNQLEQYKLAIKKFQEANHRLENEVVKKNDAITQL